MKVFSFNLNKHFTSMKSFQSKSKVIILNFKILQYLQDGTVAAIKIRQILSFSLQYLPVKMANTSDFLKMVVT